MNHIEPPIDSFQPIFIAKQPIFDREERLWGHELLYRRSAEADSAQVSDEDAATAAVIADGVVLADTGERNHVMINFPRSQLLSGAPHALPSGRCVVEVLETVLPEPEVLEQLRGLRRKGYMLALDDYVGQPELEPFLMLVEMVKVDCLGKSLPKLMHLHRFVGDGHILLAEKIENEHSYHAAWAIGYDLFQGHYFRRPQTIGGRKIPMADMVKFRLLRELSREDYEVSTLGRIIGSDTSLSYRLLRYINSAAFSFRSEVSSLKQAVTILGSHSLKQWLMAVVMADVAPNARTQELAYLCVQRGRFLELCASETDRAPRDADSMFLLGLFSELDSLMGQEMEDILEQVPLDEMVKAALLGEENDVSQWLELCRRVEEGRWEDLEQMLQSIGMKQERAGRIHAKATSWASDIAGLCGEMRVNGPAGDSAAPGG